MSPTPKKLSVAKLEEIEDAETDFTIMQTQLMFCEGFMAIGFLLVAYTAYILKPNPGTQRLLCGVGLASAAVLGVVVFVKLKRNLLLNQLLNRYYQNHLRELWILNHAPIFLAAQALLFYLALRKHWRRLLKLQAVIMLVAAITIGFTGLFLWEHSANIVHEELRESCYPIMNEISKKTLHSFKCPFKFFKDEGGGFNSNC